jgi:Cro/C1-type helix-turn-helix DNA-binding protein
MPIVVKLDDMLHARRMTLTELADRIGITVANLSILMKLQRPQPLRRGRQRATRAWLYGSADQHKTEFYKWLRSELPDGSTVDRDIRRAMLDSVADSGTPT